MDKTEKKTDGQTYLTWWDEAKEIPCVRRWAYDEIEAAAGRAYIGMLYGTDAQDPLDIGVRGLIELLEDEEDLDPKALTWRAVAVAAFENATDLISYLLETYPHCIDWGIDRNPEAGE